MPRAPDDGPRPPLPPNPAGHHDAGGDEVSWPAWVEQALHALPAHIALLDPAGTIAWTNEAWNRFAETNGFRGEAYGLGSNYPAVCEASQGEDRPQALAVAHDLRAVLAGQLTRFSLEYACHSPEARRWFQVTAVGRADGGALVVHTEITGVKVAEAALRDREQRFRALIEYSTDLLTVLDEEARIRFASPAAAAALNTTPERAAGRPVFEIVHPEDHARLHAAVRALLATPGGLQRIELHVRRSGGGWRVVDATARNLLDVPAIGGIVVNARDVTDQRRLEADLAQARKLEALGRLAGGVAHEFNNLLTVIKGYSDLVYAELPEDSVLRADVHAIAHAAERAASITRQLLQFARRHTASPVVLDVGTSLSHLQMLLPPVLGESVLLDVHVAHDLSAVYFDPTELEQVLINLALNARDAMPRGGRITIEARNAVPDPDGARRILTTEHVVIGVSDSGVGMSAEIASHLFEPFFTTKEAGKGTGLGLATSLGIVERHGGTITFQTAPGAGSTFEVHVPRAPVAETPESRVLPAAAGRQERVLVVEDEAPVRSYTTQVLRKRGYRVFEAASGREALDLAHQLDAPVDLVVTDLMMPGMSGVELAAALIQQSPGVRVLFVSGYPAETFTSGGAAIPPDRFLAKPYAPEELARKVRALLDRPAGEP